jgi:hypothetical protein
MLSFVPLHVSYALHCSVDEICASSFLVVRRTDPVISSNVSRFRIDDVPFEFAPGPRLVGETLVPCALCSFPNKSMVLPCYLKTQLVLRERVACRGTSCRATSKLTACIVVRVFCTTHASTWPAYSTGHSLLQYSIRLGKVNLGYPDPPCPLCRVHDLYQERTTS